MGKTKDTKRFKWSYIIMGIILFILAGAVSLWSLSFYVNIDIYYDLNKKVLELFKVSGPTKIGEQIYLSNQYQGFVAILMGISILLITSSIYLLLNWLLGRIILVKSVWRLAIGIAVALAIILFLGAVLFYFDIFQPTTFKNLGLYSPSPANHFLPDNWVLPN